jgi:RNA polymerase sigma-70 factor (ECF subfamily)
MPLDRDQFRVLFESERDRVHRFLWRLSGSAADADDLLQESFLSAWRHRDAFDGRGSSAGWLMKTAFRTYLNHRRGEQRRASRNGHAAPPVPPGGVDHVERRDALRFARERVEQALADLPEEPRAAFVLFRLEGLRVAEIADLTDASPKTVETRIRRATLLLAERLHALRPHLPASQP